MVLSSTLEELIKSEELFSGTHDKKPITNIREVKYILDKMLSHTLDNNASKCEVSYEAPGNFFYEVSSVSILNDILSIMIKENPLYHNISRALITRMSFDNMTNNYRITMEATKMPLYIETNHWVSFEDKYRNKLNPSLYSHWINFSSEDVKPDRSNPKHEFDY